MKARIYQKIASDQVFEENSLKLIKIIIKDEQSISSFDEKAYDAYLQLLTMYENNPHINSENIIPILENYWVDFIEKHWEVSGMQKMLEKNNFIDHDRCNKVIDFYTRLSQTKFFIETAYHIGKSNYYCKLAHTYEARSKYCFNKNKMQDINQAIDYYKISIQCNRDKLSDTKTQIELGYEPTGRVEGKIKFLESDLKRFQSTRVQGPHSFHQPQPKEFENYQSLFLTKPSKKC